MGSTCVCEAGRTQSQRPASDADQQVGRYLPAVQEDLGQALAVPLRARSQSGLFPWKTRMPKKKQHHEQTDRLP